VKDKHTYGKIMARKGPTTVVYQYLSFPIRVYFDRNIDLSEKIRMAKKSEGN